MKAFFRTLAAIALLVLAGCLDTREEVWIRPDGSGSANISVTMPAAALSIHGGEEGVKELIEAFLAETPAITSHVLATRREGDRFHVDLAMTFSNAMDLMEETSGPAGGGLPGAAAELIGKSEVVFKGTDLVFTRTVELSKAFPGSIFIPRSQLEGRSVTTILHLPRAATSHNATATADGGSTLIWETPLAEAFKKPRVTEFTMPLPIPWGYVCLVVLLVLVVFAVLILYLRRRKRAAEVA